MPSRQSWKTKVRGIFKLLNSSSAKEKAARNEELEFTSSAIYSDDSDDYDPDKEEVKKFGFKRGPLSIKSVSSSDNITINSRDLQECYECGKLRTFNWCKNCESKNFIKNFSNWTSENVLLDKFIRNTQYKAYNHRYYWEWIPFEKFSNIQFLANGGQTDVFTAIWLEGPRNQWDNENMIFIRRKWCKVILKRLLYSPNNISPKFINELRKYYGHQSSRCSRTVQIYGLTIDPKSGHYMLVTAYHNKLDIRTLLQESSKLSWSDKLRLLHDCAEALLDIHSKGHIHKNIHPGNLLLHSRGKNIFLNISDLGLCNYDNNNNYEEIMGVIPYVAPEIFNCWPYTQDSDIYSFSMLMFELATGRPPFYDRAHDQHLIFDICEGLRPKFNFNELPYCFIELMKQCWNTEPVSRPSANEILFTIKNWNINDFTYEEFDDKDFEIHPDAIYISRPLGELISRELELQDQVWEETELYEQDDEMEGSSFASASEDEESDDEESDDEENDERVSNENDERVSNENDERVSNENDEGVSIENDEGASNENNERVSNSESNIEHEDDNSELVETKTNEFQLKLELNFNEFSSDLKKINEMGNQNNPLHERDNDSDDGDDDDDDDDDEEDEDDSLIESSSNNTISPNTSVFEEESKHDDDISN